MALTVFESGLCSGCGEHMDDSMTIDADRMKGDGTHYYEAPPPRRCHACDAMAIRSAAYREADRPEALRFGFERHDRHPPTEAVT